MKTGTDMMASPLFSYPRSRRRRWPFRNRWLLFGAGLLVAQGLVLLVALETGPW